MRVALHNIADALRGRGAKFAPTSTREEPIDRLYRLIGGPKVWQVSPELDQLFRAMVHKDPMARPSASDILHCDWMRRGDEVTEAEVVAAFERRLPVSEEAHNTMSVSCAPRLKDTAKAFEALLGALRTLEWPGGGESENVKPEVHEDRDRLTATAVVGETRIRAILIPTEGLIAKNPTTPFDPGAVDPVAAMKKAARLAREREQSATPVVRLVWIGGSAGAMQLVNVYVHVSAILSA